MLHQHPIALEKDVLRRRIYAPIAYAPVRNTAIIPVVHSECLALASRFPLVWRQCDDGTIDFVAIRSLLDDQRSQPIGARSTLPLILQAYPFMFEPADRATSISRRMLDDVFADQPTDAGAPITTVNRKLARASVIRLGLLDRIAAELDVTLKIGRAIAALKLFEPWPLTFTIEGQTIGLPGLLVIRPAAFDQAQLGQLVGEFGMSCAQMLSLHRISLFCAGSLLAAARTFLRDSKAGPDSGHFDAQLHPHRDAMASMVSS